MGGGKGGSTSFTQRPLNDQELKLVESQTKYNNLTGDMAVKADNRSTQSQADWEKYYRPVELGNTDPSTGLMAATVAGNDSNQLALNNFLNGSKANADTFNNGTQTLSEMYARQNSDNARRYGSDAMANAQNTANTIGGYANDYNNFMGGINNSMGQADQGILARLRADNTSGLSTANNAASRSLQAQLAQRGMTSSGIGAKSLTDLNSNYMQQLGGANAQAYGQAVNQSDQMRMNQVGINNQRLQGMIGASQAGGEAVGGAIDKQYNANQGSLGVGYGALGSALQNAYNTNNAQQGGALNAISSGNQQRISNLTNYSQLGRGMAGMSANYLGQAGQMYGQAANGAQGMFNSMGSQNLQYNQMQNQSKQASDAAKGASAQGAGQLAMTGAMMMSDERLKDNITKIGTVGKLNLYTWVWNEEAQRIEANHAPAIGVIAQEVQKLYPDAVAEQTNGYMAVDYNKVIAYAKGSK